MMDIDIKVVTHNPKIVKTLEIVIENLVRSFLVLNALKTDDRSESSLFISKL